MAPPKKEKMSQNIKTLCIRCPDLESAQACEAGKKKSNIIVCSADPISDQLWPGFVSDDSTNISSLSVSIDTSKYQKMLKHAQVESDDAVIDSIMGHNKKKPEQFGAICEARGRIEFEKFPLTKQMLNVAYQRLLPSGADSVSEAESTHNTEPEEKKESTPDYSDVPPGALAANDVQRESTSQNTHRNQQKAYEQPEQKAFSSIKAAHDPNSTFLSAAALKSGQHATVSKKAAKAGPHADLSSLRYPLRPLTTQAPSDTYKVLTNHFVVTVSPRGKYLYEYTGTSNIPGKLSKPKKRMLLHDMIESDTHLWKNKSSIATDGTSKLVSSTPLYSSNHEVRINNFQAGQNQNPPATATMNLIPGKVHSLEGLSDFVSGKKPTYEDRGASDALNIFLSKALVNSNEGQTFQVGSNKVFYRPAWEDIVAYGVPDQPGLIAVRGYHSAIRPSMGGVLLNVNKVTSAFYKAQPLTEYLDNFYKAGKYRLEDATEHLKSLRVRIMINRHRPGSDDDPSIDDEGRRVKTIAGFGEPPKAQKLIPETEFGSTVWEHMTNKYGNIDDAVAKYPTVNVGSFDENGVKQFYLASQLNVVADHAYRGVLPSKVTEEMIKITRKTPAENLAAILNEGIPTLGLNSKVSSIDFSIDTRPVSVPARHIAAPAVRYGAVDVQKTGASWKPHPNAKFGKQQSFAGQNPRGKPKVQFFCPSTMLAPHLASWYVDSFTGMHAEVGLQQVELLDEKAKYEVIHDWTVDGLEQLLARFQAKGMHIAIVIFPRESLEHKPNYVNFRVAADLRLGIHSICFSEERMHKSLSKFRPDSFDAHSLPPEKALVDYVRNVCMKLNLRGGNHNHLLHSDTFVTAKIQDKTSSACQTLILGADVTHPSPGKHRKSPSIAAVVGSIDSNFAVFPGSVRLNPSKQEWIEDMEDMVTERLEEWSKKNGSRLPSRILYYRDGVGDPYFGEILDREHNAIKSACKQALKGQKKVIPVTTVVVTKRHHVRFFPRNDAPSHLTYKGNCAPGTMVESGITHPHFFDFYLQSQQINAGSAKPAHYFVLADEIGFTSRHLQDLTYHLCFSYGRSLNSVSYVPPAYYADRLCERARLYLVYAYVGTQLTEDSTEAEMMQEARTVFCPDSTRQSQNPWGCDKHRGTMFWM